jgi:glutathione S-transferase
MSGTLKISYWPIGGRAAAARLALTLKDIPHEFEPVPFDKWQDWKQDTARFPTQDIPVFSVGGRVITQSAALTQYAGLVSGLWPSDPVEAATMVEILGTQEEIFSSFFGTCLLKTLPMFNPGVPEEELAARKLKFKDHLRFYASRINDIVLSNTKSKAYAVGDKLTVADFIVWQLARTEGLEIDKLQGFARVSATVNAINKPGFNELRAQFAS